MWGEMTGEGECGGGHDWLGGVWGDMTGEGECGGGHDW